MRPVNFAKLSLIASYPWMVLGVLAFAQGCSLPPILYSSVTPEVKRVSEAATPAHGEASGETRIASGYVSSGSIVLSRSIPEPAPIDASFVTGAGPVLGYIPPTEGFLPADNEAWLEIESETKTLNVYRGDTRVASLQAEGEISLVPGKYALQHKQTRPFWYAPDDYFAKRQLPIPSPGDRQRYRVGALGQFVLYPTTSFPIHSGAVWSPDVGGLRLSRSDLASIFYLLPLRSLVVVK